MFNYGDITKGFIFRMLCKAARASVLQSAHEKRRETHLNLSSQPSVGAVGKAVEPARCNILQLFLAQVAQPANHAPKYPAQTACTSARGSCCCIGSVVD
mgnify:FL=1